ncbi:MAG: hypothetical protein Q9183_005276, partial [Haloplaca sp. 2 TL-2023]
MSSLLPIHGGSIPSTRSWTDILPTNSYPFHNALSPIVSTLFTGSAIVVKSSEQTAFSASYFISIARNALAACNHSPNLVQSVICWPQTANHLTSHPGISHITFIGSRAVAHQVCASAAKALTPVCVELGGKDPAIILDDLSPYDLEHKVLPILMKGIFVSAGQNCIGIERIIALPRSYEILLPLLEKRIRDLRVGTTFPPAPLSSASLNPNNRNNNVGFGHDGGNNDSIDIGPLISPQPIPHLHSLIRSAVSMGATLHVGGPDDQTHRLSNTHYFSPSLLSSLQPDMPISQQELFAPIALLFPATSLTHAISIANSTPFALGASVFGTSSTDLETCTTEIKAGMVSVNDFGAYYATGMPFGGVKG